MTIKKKGSEKKKKPESSNTSMRLLPAKDKGGSAISANRKTQAADQLMRFFPIVGIGASTGGFAAFEAFFSGMPTFTEPGMAFVLVQHLAPDHQSILTGLIQRYTRMQVSEAEEGMAVRPNCAYIIPPGRDMAFTNGALHLFEPSPALGQRQPIDFFFKSLAQDQHDRAICIVLSGTGSDGTLGVRAIKGEGGMAMAQDPDSTEHDDMPRSAIATGLIDYKLPPAEMPAQLMAYVAHAFSSHSQFSLLQLPTAENTRQTIFNMLRGATGHDFSQYLPSTMNRRIDRRMAVRQITTMDGYVEYLQQTPAELEALFRDMLIGVTEFFRDPETFKALAKQIIPRLFASKPAGAVVRIWSLGCSTGEEAYSLAILLQEYLGGLKQKNPVQVFGTDIDSRAIATARAGLYPASIAANVSPERLARFFSTEQGDGYRIHKAIREMVIFSEHNVINDPPFSKLDLISCRNLLISLSVDLQNKIIPLFHYALKPGGYLFLGTSETTGKFADMFTVVDRKIKLYRRRNDIHCVHRLTPGWRPASPTTMPQPQLAGRRTGPGKLTLRELTEQTLLQLATPTGALVNGRGDILYLHGPTGMYLEPAPGEDAVHNILAMAREGLRHELASALNRATTSGEVVRRTDLRVKTNSSFVTVNLTITKVVTGPTPIIEAPLYLVILEEVASVTSGGSANPDRLNPSPELEKDLAIAALRQELLAKEEYLHTATEELKSANEEMQSINEEMATVNAELQINVADLTRANIDTNNVLAGTGIGMVFIDHGLRVQRFTPDVTRLINLIPSDAGRPVGHIVANFLEYKGLAADAKTVLKTLIPKETDVQATGGDWYTMRIHPYRAMDNIIEGVVITFVDINQRKRVEEALQKASEEIKTLRDIIEHSSESAIDTSAGK